VDTKVDDLAQQAGGDAGPETKALGSAPPEKVVQGWLGWVMAVACVLYAGWHLYVLNVAPLETWAFRISHVAGALAIGFLLSAAAFATRREPAGPAALAVSLAALAAVAVAAGLLAWLQYLLATGTSPIDLPKWILGWFGPILAGGTLAALLASWIVPAAEGRIRTADWALALAALAVGAYFLIGLDTLGVRLRAGTPFADPSNAWAAVVGVVLILELTRRLAGMALVGICAAFVVYAFVGPWLPGFLNHGGYGWERFFTYVYTDNGILGPTTAVSSTYIILFIIFAAFLQETRVGQYFVDFSFALAGRARGGPAKVAVFASGLMGTINGTSAGNVVATGSITIPLMKSVGYRPQTAGAIEATASTGGQIMPPIMGAGAFIMAEVTGIPYTEIVVAAIIPALLYFLAIFLMVHIAALKLDMKGLPADQLPDAARLARQAFLFAPLVILIAALFMGYSVIRAGTYAIAAAAAVSWLTPHRMGPRRLFDALAMSSGMALQIIAVCAAAGIIVGVIALTGVGARFSALLLGVAEANVLLALVFAMIISIILGMGMPTTAAYAVAASVVAPGLIQMGVEPLVAHFFVFYFAVMSAVTPPVALAAYAASAIAGTDAMRTSVESFRFGLTAFIVPFMFFYDAALLGQGSAMMIAWTMVTAGTGVWALSHAIQGWLYGRIGILPRIALAAAALFLISVGPLSDATGFGLFAAVGLWARWRHGRRAAAAA